MICKSLIPWIFGFPTILTRWKSQVRIPRRPMELRQFCFSPRPICPIRGDWRVDVLALGDRWLRFVSDESDAYAVWVRRARYRSIRLALDPYTKTGGTNTTGIVVNSGVLNPELLKGEKGGRIWPKMRLKDRIDAIIQTRNSASAGPGHRAASIRTWQQYSVLPSLIPDGRATMERLTIESRLRSGRHNLTTISWAIYLACERGLLKETAQRQPKKVENPPIPAVYGLSLCFWD